LEGGVYVGSKDHLRAIFDDWSNDDAISVVETDHIPVFGSKPGQIQTEAQQEQLN
jgi:hypothetical protein